MTLLLGLLPLISGCDDLRQSCTRLGCTDTLSITVSNASELDEGTYTLSLALVDRQSTCTFNVSEE